MRVTVFHDYGKRMRRCEIAFDAAQFPMVSGVHARIDAVNGQFHLVHESRSNKTLLN